MAPLGPDMIQQLHIDHVFGNHWDHNDHHLASLEKLKVVIHPMNVKVNAKEKNYLTRRMPTRGKLKIS